MRFLLVCSLFVLGLCVISIEAKSVAKSPEVRSLCIGVIDCFIDPCEIGSCPGLCFSDCHCNAICSR